MRKKTAIKATAISTIVVRFFLMSVLSMQWVNYRRTSDSTLPSNTMETMAELTLPLNSCHGFSDKVNLILAVTLKPPPLVTFVYEATGPQMLFPI